jgi:hypothetical protein
MKGKGKASPTVAAVDWPDVRNSHRTPAVGDYLYYNYDDPTMTPSQAQALLAPTVAQVSGHLAVGNVGPRPTAVWGWLA